MSTYEKSVSDTEQLRRRNRELSILNSIAETLNRSVDLNQTLDAALAKVTELLDLHTGWIWLLQETNNDAYLAAVQNLPPGLKKNPGLMEGSCYCLDTYQAGDLDGAANVNVVTCSRLRKLVDGTDGLRYHASIPLYAHGKKLGVLNVASQDWRELTPDNLRLLYTVGDMLGIAVERARLFTRSAEFGAVDERNRLAREIHDTLAQGLAGITLQLESAEALLETGSDPLRINRAIQQALELARSSLEEARRSVLDLRAVPLEGRNLAQALTALVESTNARERYPITSQITGGNQPLPVRIEVGLYRIAQEAIANIIQHAQADQASLELAIQPDQLTLTVQDNGRGFDPDRIPQGHYGLIGLNERTRLLGGSFTVHSSPGAGTRLVVNIPLIER
jgi:two-component system NarL family sensor kinase